MYLAVNHENGVAALSASAADAVKVVRTETRKMGDAPGDVRVTNVRLNEAFLVSRADMQPPLELKAPRRARRG